MSLETYTPYDPKSWNTTDFFTPTFMNHIENGIAQVDAKTADEIVFSSGTSIKSQIDTIDLREGGTIEGDINLTGTLNITGSITGDVKTIHTQTVTGTTDSNGYINIPSSDGATTTSILNVMVQSPVRDIAKVYRNYSGGTGAQALIETRSGTAVTETAVELTVLYAK